MQLLGDRLDHDALAGALLGRFECVLDQMVGDAGDTARTVRAMTVTFDPVVNDGFSEVFRLFFHHPEAIVAGDKDVRGDLLADAVSGA